MVKKNKALLDLKKEQEELEALIKSLSDAIKRRADDGTKSFSLEGSQGSRRVENISLKELMEAREQARRSLEAVNSAIEEPSHSRFIQTRFT